MEKCTKTTKKFFSLKAKKKHFFENIKRSKFKILIPWKKDVTPGTELQVD